MKSLFTICLIILVIFYIIGCKCDEVKTYEEFKNGDLEWLLYNDGDTLKFNNHNSDTVLYFVLESIGYAKTFPHNKCNKHYDKDGFQQIKPIQFSEITGYISIIRTSDNEPLKITVGAVSSSERLDLFSNNLDTFNVNGFIFNNVYKIYNTYTTQTNPGELKKFYFNKEYGFLLIELINGEFIKIIK